MDKITLTTKLNIDDYIKVNYHLLYRKWSVRFLFGMGAFMLIMIIEIVFFEPYTQFPWLLLIFGLFFTIGLPIIVYFTAKKVYKSNGRVSEMMIYEFDNEYFQITGESFNSKQTWNKVHSVTENKDWILIWQNQQIANVVPKRNFKGEELKLFRELVSRQTGLKNKLKK